MGPGRTPYPLWAGQRDGALVAGMLYGDQLAAGELFRRYHPRLVRRMAYWTRDRGRADDLAQDAWAKAVAALSRFDQDAPFWPWLRCIGDNVARSDLRSRLVGSGEERVVYIDDDVLAQTPADADDEGRVDDAASISGALHAIPPRQRDAFIAVAYGGAPMALAATDFGLKENAFRQLYHRARHSLRQELEGVLGAPPVLWWCRLRTAVKDALTAGPTATMAQSAAAVAGLVTIVVLAPAMDIDGRASPNSGVDGRTTAAAAVESAADASSPRTDMRHPAAVSRRTAHPESHAGRPARDAAIGTGRNENPRPPLVEAPSAQVGGSAIRGDQKSPTDPDISYGVRVDAPGAPRQQLRYKAKDSSLQPLHEVACDVAASSPVTYCDP